MSRAPGALLGASEYLRVFGSAFAGAPPSAEGERRQLREQVVASDTLARKLFASGRGDGGFELPELEDNFLGLIPVHQYFEAFGCAHETAEEASTPKVFPLASKARKAPGQPSVVDSNDFLRACELFTENQLRDLDWTGVFAAGGSILACLQPLPETCRTNRQKRKYMHDIGFPASDVDLFLYGLTPEQATAKILEIYATVCDNCPFDVLCFRSAHAISMVSQYPYRHIQVVLRLYHSPSEVLNGFDVDSCAVGFDGTQAWCTQRAHLALVTQTNLVDMSRRSPTYEMRLAKYAGRGFQVAVPGLDRSRVDPMLMEKPWKHVQGLGKLLLLEKLKTPEARFRYKEQQRGQQMQRLYTSTFARRFQFRSMIRSPYNAGRMETVRAGGDASDYSTVFLPWGPGHTAHRCARLMRAKDAMLNNSFLNRGRKYHLHPCFIGTAEQVVKDCAPRDSPVPADADPQELAGFVRGELTFIEDNPGRQMIGSFHPIDDTEAGELCYATAANDTQRMAAALRENGVTVNVTDYCGRTPLHIAALGGCTEAAEMLLGAGADPIAPMADGRSAIHVAAAYGHTDILRLLLAQEAVDSDKLSYKDWNFKMTSLHFALIYGQSDAAELVLKAGADPNGAWVIEEEHPYSPATKTPVPPLLVAASVFKWDKDTGETLVKLLLEAGASSTRLDLQLNSLLHLGILDDNATFVASLLNQSPESKACLNVLSVEQKTPLALAASAGNDEAVDILLAAGVSATIDQAAVDTTRQRAAALLKQESARHNYKVKRLSSLQLNTVEQPLTAAVRDLCSNHENLVEAAKASAELQKAEFTAASGGPDAPEKAPIPKDPFRCVKALLAAGGPVNEVTRQAAASSCSYRSQGSSTPAGTLVDEVIAKVRQLKDSCGQHGLGWYTRLTDTIKQLSVDPSTGLVHGLKTSSMKTLDSGGAAERADHTYRQACFTALAVSEQVKSLFEVAVEVSHAVGTAEDMSEQAKCQKALVAAEHLLQILRDAGGLTYQEVQGGDAIELPTDGNGSKASAPHCVELFFQAVEGSQGNGAAVQLSSGYMMLGKGGGHLPDAKHSLYDKLFAACWAGDAATVQKLTEDPENPTWITVKEVHSAMTPYMLALLAGHTELADQLLKIGQAQYSSPEIKQKRGTGGEDHTKVNNYSLVAAMEECDLGSNSADEESDDNGYDDEEGGGGYYAEDDGGEYGDMGGLVADVVSTAAAHRSEAANALDAAEGIAISTGTAKEEPVNHCRVEEFFFVESFVPTSLLPGVVPAEWVLTPNSWGELLQRIMESILDLSGSQLEQLMKTYPTIFRKLRMRRWGVETRCPVFLRCDPLRLCILRGVPDCAESLLAACAAVMPKSDIPQSHKKGSSRSAGQPPQPERKSVSKLMLSGLVQPLQLAIYMDDPKTVELLLRTAGGGLPFESTLAQMWEAAEVKPKKAVPAPRILSLAAMAAKHRSLRVLEWVLGGGPVPALTTYLESEDPGTSAALRLAALLPHVGKEFPTEVTAKQKLPVLPISESVGLLQPLLCRFDQRHPSGTTAAHTIVSGGDAAVIQEVARIAAAAGQAQQFLAAVSGGGKDDDKQSAQSPRRQLPITPLHAAALGCDVPMVSALLAAGADCRAPDVMPGRGWNIVSFLLVSKQKEEKLIPALQGLMGAVSKAHGEDTLADLLTERQGKQKLTPLMVAQTFNSAAVVEALLGRLKDLRARQEALAGASLSGRTALHLSVRSSRTDATSAMLSAAGEDAGPLVNREDLMGCTAVDMAQTTYSHVASKSLAAVAAGRQHGQRWPRLNGPKVTKEAKCLDLIAEASRPNRLREVATFEEVVAVRNMSAEEANKHVEEAGAQASALVMTQSRNLNAQEEQALSASVSALPAMGPCLRDQEGWKDLLARYV